MKRRRKCNNPSKFRIEKDIIYLELYNKEGEVTGETLIDIEDYDKVKYYRLHKAEISKYSEYARVKTNDGKKLHHLIIGTPPKGLYTDHINRNPLDNRKCNLRVVTPSQNGMNRTHYKNKTSIYKGVHWDKNRKKWKVEIKLNRVARYIGRFDNEIEAAVAYNEKAKELFGEYGALNKINKKLFCVVIKKECIKCDFFIEDGVYCKIRQGIAYCSEKED